MARASVKLMKGSSFNGQGHKFGKAETKIVSGNADIAYFKGNPRFRVSMMADAPVDKSVSKKNDGGSDGLLPWKKTMRSRTV